MSRYCVGQQTYDINALPDGELTPLPVPDRCFDFRTLDFITVLPTNVQFNVIMVCIERLTKLVRLVPSWQGMGSSLLLQFHCCFLLVYLISMDYHALFCMIAILDLQAPFSKHCLTYSGVKYSFPVSCIHKLMAKQTK